MAKKIKISVASDHAGYDLKKEIVKYLRAGGYEVADRGTKSANKSVDYPDYTARVVNDVLSKNAARGILVCGTGLGMSIGANRFRGIRAAVVHDITTAEAAAKHNHANVLCLAGRLTAPYLAQQMVQKWLDTPFEARHKPRLDMIEDYAKGK